jgi:hypothetical protein
MNHLLIHLLRSLLITGILSFIAPSLFIGVIWAVLILLSYIPLAESVGQVGVGQLLNFLTIFGNGSSIRGLLTIGLVCSLVGVLFDTYTFYRYQKLNG